MIFNHGAYYFIKGSWQHLGRDYKKAMTKYAELNEGPEVLGKMAGLMDRYMKEVVPTKAPRTQRNNLNEIRRLRAVFARMRPQDIRPQDIYEYMDARNAPIAANREKALLSSIFGYGIRWGIVTDNPCRYVKRNPEKPRDRYVEDWEYELVWKLSPNIVRCAMDLALLTGLRLGDLLRIRLQDLREDGIYVQTGKTNRKLLIEWSEELREVVNRTRQRKISGLYLLCTREGQRYTEDGFKSLWQRAMAKTVAKGMRRFTFHDIRGKAASDADDPATLLAHDDPKTTERVYRRKRRRVTPAKPDFFGKR